MTTNQQQAVISLATEAIYQGLFGFGTAEANELLGLPATIDETGRRDGMGIVALNALTRIESAIAQAIEAYGKPIHEFTVIYTSRRVALEVARNLLPLRGAAILTASVDANQG